MNRYWFSIGVFFVYLFHGMFLGITDDEAYYWVLSQRPALGYAFHPPAVAWLIAGSRFLFGWLVSSVMVVRLPAAFLSALIVFYGLSWMVEAGASAERVFKKGAAVFISFAGFFASAWMMVPDLPLFAGWVLVFITVWKICFSPAIKGTDYWMLGAGITLALLSKYSAVLVGVSAMGALFLWAPSERRIKSITVVILSTVIAFLPILVWNMEHNWASILYQIHDRHTGDGFSLLRYGRFWMAEMLLAGPPLVFFGFRLVTRLRGSDARVSRYISLWVVPPACIFLLQPLWSNFKLHWAFVVWFPLVLELGWYWSVGRVSGWFAKTQMIYGFLLIGIMLFSCHIPLVSWFNEKMTGRTPDPKWDVTNDMYGWADIQKLVRMQAGDEALNLPVVGSRYQTAAQAAFAWGDASRVTFLPRTEKELDEWPNLGVSLTQGPDWPTLTNSVLFVTDNRYNQKPAFPDSVCKPLGRLEVRRWIYFAKWIDVWKCDPKHD